VAESDFFVKNRSGKKIGGIILDSRRTVYLVETDKLEIHPFNEKVFFDHEDEYFDYDIQTYGIRSPIIINSKNQILDGRRRYLRAKKFGLTEIPCIIENYEDEELAILMLNKYRCKSYRELYREAEELEKKYKKLFHVGRSSADEEKTRQKLTEFSSVRDKVAYELDLSAGKLHQLKIIFQNEDKFPQIIRALENEKISVNKAYQCAKLILENGMPESKVLKKVLGSDILVNGKKKKRFVEKKKEYMVNCPKCNELLLSDKKVTLMTLEDARKQYIQRKNIF